MPTSVRLEKELEARLDRLAAATGRTKAYYLREIIAQGIVDMEDHYLATEVLARIRRGEEPVYSSAEIRKGLGLDG